MAPPTYAPLQFHADATPGIIRGAFTGISAAVAGPTPIHSVSAALAIKAFFKMVSPGPQSADNFSGYGRQPTAPMDESGKA
jgi:hypothetical protein